MKLLTTALLLGALLFGSAPLAAADEKATTLMLFSGAGIRPAAEALIAAFEAKNPTIKISATYGGSGQLLGQISSIKRGDLFMPGEDIFLKRAIEMGLAEEATRVRVGAFIPVIFVGKGNPRQIATLSDLAAPGLRLAVGDERYNAVGVKCVALLEQIAKEKPNIRDNIVFKSATVDELAIAVKLGTVDATILWSVVAAHYGEAGVAIPFPESMRYSAEIPLARLKHSNAPEAASAFIAFAASPLGQAIVAKLGYGPEIKAALDNETTKIKEEEK